MKDNLTVLRQKKKDLEIIIDSYTRKNQDIPKKISDDYDEIAHKIMLIKHGK